MFESTVAESSEAREEFQVKIAQVDRESMLNQVELF
jgi:hypothetical protein